MKPVVVWFKRDLRVKDHIALTTALTEGPIIPLYVVESAYWRQTYTSFRQWTFLKSALLELDEVLTNLGQPIWSEFGQAELILDQLHDQFKFDTIHSHQETGPAWTFERDGRIREWCISKGVNWIEHRQHGISRGLKTRDKWASKWEQLMDRPSLPVPDKINGVGVPPKSLGDCLKQLHWSDVSEGLTQVGGTKTGYAMLQSFLSERGENYRVGMSSPITAEHACSRLSPHLSVGTVSIRDAWQLSQYQREMYKAIGERSRFVASLKSFGSRLHWHCHFMQKLESEPRLEFEALHRGFIGLREPSEISSERFDRFATAQLGWPFVDACLRCLKSTGWINFRMRAMLVSIASYHLWIDWRLTAGLLASWFTDFEAGIHFSQVQMQSGITGINANRIYSPIKQSEEHDPEGIFIRRWLPELSALPTEWIHTPWRMPHSLQLKLGVVIGLKYPDPIGDPIQMAREARARIGDWIHKHDLKAEAQRVLKVHGSRSRQLRPRYNKKDPDKQLVMNLK